MLHCDTLIAPRWCAPIDADDRVLTEHAIVINDGRILDVLPLPAARQKYQPSVFVERPDHLLIPGLINTHTHAALSLMRGMADDMMLHAWLNDAIWPLEKRWMSAELVRDGTELAIAEMIASGTTCFSDQYFFPEIVAEAAVDAQMRAMIGTPIIEFATVWADSATEYMDKAGDLVHDPYAAHPLISTCFAPHSTCAMSDDSFVALRVRADQLDVPIQIHLHETAAEIDKSLADTGKRPIERLQELGLVNSSLLAVHSVHLTDEEIAIFADSGVNVAHCPKSNMKLASGIAPVGRLRAAGVNVSIGTDSAASNNSLDMLSEMRAAALLAKVSSGDACIVSAMDTLRMATIDAATALGMAHETGSVTAGKWADLTCVDLSPLHSQPVYDPISQLVYTARADQVSDVWIAGRHQLENGILTHINTANVLQRSHEWRDRFTATPV